MLKCDDFLKWWNLLPSPCCCWCSPMNPLSLSAVAAADESPVIKAWLWKGFAKMCNNRGSISSDVASDGDGGFFLPDFFFNGPLFLKLGCSMFEDFWVGLFSVWRRRKLVAFGFFFFGLPFFFLFFLGLLVE